MPNYEAWNDAIIEFFTYGAPAGSTIYLEVSDRNLDVIGRQTWDWKPHTTWADDFVSAVRTRLDVENPSFLRRWRRTERRSRPLGVAFLGALVLVASRMDRAPDQAISEKNFYRRLNDALGTEPTNDQVQRPRFMQLGSEAEEPLWQDWAAYLRELGYLPTAVGGRGAWRYIGYAVSQTLLRGPEKRKLFRIFDEKQWGADIDPDHLVNEIRRIDALPVHVHALLRRTGQAAEDVHHALNEAFSEWLERGEGEDPGVARSRSGASALVAGLYRLEHWRTREPVYSLFPRQPRSRRWGTISVELPDDTERLTVERPGYFAPLGLVGKEALEQGAQYAIRGHSDINVMVLPRRRFWILRDDPNVPGAFASLGRPLVGEHLLVLAQDELESDMQRLREIGLVQWSHEHPWSAGWREYHGAMVIANHWGDAVGVDLELREALAPASGVSVSVTGGMIVPRTAAWLADGPPVVRVNSFFNDVTLQVIKDGVEVWTGPVEPNAEVENIWRGPGSYEIDAESRGQGQRRLVNLIDWDELPPPSTGRLDQVEATLGAVHLRGPRVTDTGADET